MCAKPHGILVFGISELATMALGKELAKQLGFAYFSIDDFLERKRDIRKRDTRPREGWKEPSLANLQDVGACVLSGNMMQKNRVLLPCFDLAIYVATPMDIRTHAAYEKWMQELSCPVVRVEDERDCQQCAAKIIEMFYTKMGEPWRVRVAKCGELEKYSYSVVFARKDGLWLYARHKQRNTWETAGGHVEPGETVMDCAKRELFEETGATRFTLHPAFDYGVSREKEFSYGQVFFAEVEAIGKLPPYSEMEDVCALPGMPGAMTYPKVLPVLFAEMKKWLQERE